MREFILSLCVLLVGSTLAADVDVTIDVPTAGPTSIAIYNAQDRLVRTLANAANYEAGQSKVAWDLRDNDGQPVQPGAYIYRTANGTALKPQYVATVANGRHPQVKGDLGNVEGMALFEIKIDTDGTIYTSGGGHGKRVQKITPDGRVGKAGVNISVVEVVSAIALNDQYVFAIGDRGFYRLDKKTMKVVPWPSGDVATLYEQKPKWYPAGGKWDQYEVLRQEAKDSLDNEAGSDDPRRFGWRGIMRHPQWFYEADRARGADIWGGRLLVSDNHYNLIRVHDAATGKFIEAWEGFENPNGIVVVNDAEALVVANGKVLAINSNGKIQREVVKEGLTRPAALAVDVKGRIYVTDLGIPNQVKVFTPDGKLLKTFGEAGPINGAVTHDKLWIPRGIAVDRRGKIILSEFGLNRIQKLSPNFKPIWDLQAFYCYLGAHDQSDPNVLYGFEGPQFPVIKQFEIDYETGRWKLNRAWYFHWFNDAGSFYGYPSDGGGAVTLGGNKYVYVNHKTLRIYRLDGDRLLPVVRIGARVSFTRADGTRADYMRGTAPSWSIWHDLNHNQRVDTDEVSVLPNSEAATQGLKYHGNDAEVTADGTAYLGNMKFPLQGIKEGIPQYDWSKVEAINLSSPTRKLGQRGIQGIGMDDQGNRYYALMEEKVGRGEFQGLTFWAKRAGWQHVVKHAPDGTRLWRAGKKAYGKVQPGEFSFITSVDCADGLVYAGDMDGYVHVFTDDGLFIKRLFKGTREGVDQGVDPYAITSHELGHVETFKNSKDGHTYIVSQSLEGGEHIRVYRMLGTDRIVRSSGSFSVTAADLEGVTSVVEKQAASGPIGPQSIAITSVLEPPAIDGQAQNWTQLVAPAEIQTADGSTVVRLTLRYDEKYLYIAAICKGDESPARNAYYPDRIMDSWKGDCFNLFINSNPKADRKRRAYGEGDFHLLFPLEKAYEKQLLHPYAYKKKTFLKDAEYRIAINDTDGWALTCRIPWRVLGDYMPVPNDKLHLNAQVDFSNADGSSYIYSLMLGRKGRSFTDPSLWNVDAELLYAR